MQIFTRAFATSIVLVLGIAGPCMPVLAQGEAHPTPQTMIDEHRAIERHLEDVSREHGKVGAAAKRVLAIIVPHQRREEEFVLPLLALLDAIVEGGVSPDMAWAVPMSKRLKAERSSFYNEHSKIVVALDDLTAAARQRHDDKLVLFCERVAGRAVNDDNGVTIPAAILVGVYVARELGIKE